MHFTLLLEILPDRPGPQFYLRPGNVPVTKFRLSDDVHRGYVGI